MTFASYAQNFEDVVLWRALGHVERGFYIDAGAFLPDVDSVTRAFSDRGWNGINIEPHPDFIGRLAAARPRDVNLAIALSDTDGQIAFHGLGRSGLATVDPDCAADHAAAGWPLSRIDVPCRRLEHVWDEHVPPGQEVHFLKVDVEGHEAAVLRGLDWTRQRPWVVVVEAIHPVTHAPSHEPWHPILEGAGYRMVYWDGLNRFYLALEQDHLAAHFDRPPNLFDDFVRDADGARDALSHALDAARAALSVAAVERADLGRRNAHAQQVIADLLEDCSVLERKLVEAEATRAALDDALFQARLQLARQSSELEATSRQRDYLVRRPFWAGLLFHRTGEPRRLVRSLLFHRSGKPRGILRSWSVHRDGRARAAFAPWMTSPAYLALRYPAAQRRPPMPGPQEQPPGPSPRAQHFLRRARAAQARRTEA